jgi:hypothetical protein
MWMAQFSLVDEIKQQIGVTEFDTLIGWTP